MADKGGAAPLAAMLGDAIAVSRRERGMTQEGLGQASGVHPTVLSRLERGGGNPSLSTLLRISDALGMELSELLRRAEEIRRLRSAASTDPPRPFTRP